MSQQGDVKLFHSLEGGEIDVTDGLVAMSAGLETAVYLSLFGGNVEDAGARDSSKEWWGNSIADTARHKLRSRTQHLIDGLPATTGNLLRLKDAAKLDLAWLVEEGVVSEVAIDVSMPGLNRVAISITTRSAEGDESFEFVENWSN